MTDVEEALRKEIKKEFKPKKKQGHEYGCGCKACAKLKPLITDLEGYCWLNREYPSPQSLK
jgi:hypothetical protein